MTDNAAGRLYQLFDELRRQPPGGSGQPAVTIRTAWAHVLGVPATESATLLQQLTYVMLLPGRAVDAVKSIDPESINVDLNLKWYHPVQASLGCLFQAAGPVVSAQQHLTAEAMLALEVCADTLHRYRPDRHLSGGLDEIKKLIDDLLQALEDADLDAELRGFLRRYARLLATAVADFKLRGIEGLEDAYDQALGALVIHRQDLIARVKEDHPTVAQRLLKVMAAIGLSLSVATSAVQLPGIVRAALEGPAKAPTSQIVIVEPGSPNSSSQTEHRNDAELAAPEPLRVP